VIPFRKNIGMVEEEQKKVLNEAQNKAEEVLGAEAELGQICKNLCGYVKGTTKVLPSNITKKLSHEVQKINKHWSIIEDYMGEMREIEQIATHTGALTAIKTESWKTVLTSHPRRC